MVGGKTGYVLPKPPVGGRGPRPKVIPFTREEIAKIFKSTRRQSVCNCRNRALFAALYRGAMRIGATLRIMPTDIDWERQLVRIYKDKRKKTRTIPLDSKTFELFRQWAEVRRSIGIDDNAPFFCACREGSRGNRLSAGSVRYVFQGLARKAGITRYVNMHLLRHTGASELLEEGFDVPTISRMLGHSNLLTTYRYLHELRPDLMNVRLTQREW